MIYLIFDYNTHNSKPKTCANLGQNLTMPAPPYVNLQIHHLKEKNQLGPYLARFRRYCTFCKAGLASLEVGIIYRKPI